MTCIVHIKQYDYFHNSLENNHKPKTPPCHFERSEKSHKEAQARCGFLKNVWLKNTHCNV